MVPSTWNNLYVADYVRKGMFPANLQIYWDKKSRYIKARFQPEIDEDPRPFQGRCNGGKGRRLWFIGKSMQTTDAEVAFKRAIAWAKTELTQTPSAIPEQEQRRYSLHHYWERYFPKECTLRETKRNFRDWKRNNLRMWSAEVYGISNQPWANKSVEQITKNDFKEYFALLERRARANNGSNGSGIKGDFKTLILKLLGLAEDDFPGHSFPSFPLISKQPKQVQHLYRDSWNLLLRTVFELGDGMESVALSQRQYKALPFNPYNRINVRNWVDLYDALILEWFFFLRAEDMYRVRSEWFRSTQDKEWICNLKTVKKDKPIHQTFHYRSDADGFLKRITKRKPKGYLVFPHKNRPVGNEAESSVLLDLNYLLKVAIEKCLPDFPKAARCWTTIRHTAFRLTLEDDPSLGMPPKINAFAENGHTSPQMLWDRYLKWIDLEKTAQEARRTIKPSTGVRWGGKYKSKKDVLASLEETLKV